MTSTEEHNLAGRRFLAVRQALGLTQQQFGESLGVALRTEQNYERGARKIPADVLLRLAREHGIDPLWVLEGPGLTPRKLSTISIDVDVLKKAQAMVSEALDESGKTVGPEIYRELVAETYKRLAQASEAEPTNDISFMAALMRTMSK